MPPNVDLSVSVEQLLARIGRLTVENELLRAKLAEALAQTPATVAHDGQVVTASMAELLRPEGEP